MEQIKITEIVSKYTFENKEDPTQESALNYVLNKYGYKENEVNINIKEDNLTKCTKCYVVTLTIDIPKLKENEVIFNNYTVNGDNINNKFLLSFDQSKNTVTINNKKKYKITSLKSTSDMLYNLLKKSLKWRCGINGMIETIQNNNVFYEYNYNYDIGKMLLKAIEC